MGIDLDIGLSIGLDIGLSVGFPCSPVPSLLLFVTHCALMVIVPDCVSVTQLIPKGVHGDVG